MLDRAHAFLLLQLLDAAAEFFHFGPVNLWTEMVLGVISVVEEKPIVNFSVTAYAPRNRLIGVGSVMPVVAVQITETMAEIPKRQEKHHEPPVDEVNWICRHDHCHHEKRGGKCRQLNVAPEIVAVVPLSQFFADRADVVAEET